MCRAPSADAQQASRPASDAPGVSASVDSSSQPEKDQAAQTLLSTEDEVTDTKEQSIDETDPVKDPAQAPGQAEYSDHEQARQAASTCKAS